MGGVCSAAIESSNVVGYTTDATGSDNNFKTVAFALVGYNTSDIQQIKISDNGAGGIGWGGEMFSVWEGLPTAVEGSGFFYTDPTMDPTFTATDYYWGDAEGNKATFSIAAGQAVVINCAADLAVTCAGQVVAEDVTFTSIQDNNFTGNPFAATIDIQAIKISDNGAGGIGWGGEMFSVWEGLPTAVEGSGFFYTDPTMDPTFTATDYYWGDAEGNKAVYPIAPGQGVVINCSEGLELTITAPYSL